MINEFIKWYDAHIIMWRKAINAYMLKEYGFILEFYPKLEGEENV